MVEKLILRDTWNVVTGYDEANRCIVKIHWFDTSSGPVLTKQTVRQQVNPGTGMYTVFMSHDAKACAKRTKK